MNLSRCEKFYTESIGQACNWSRSNSKTCRFMTWHHIHFYHLLTVSMPVYMKLINWQWLSICTLFRHDNIIKGVIFVFPIPLYCSHLSLCTSCIARALVMMSSFLIIYHHTFFVTIFIIWSWWSGQLRSRVWTPSSFIKWFKKKNQLFVVWYVAKGTKLKILYNQPSRVRLSNMRFELLRPSQLSKNNDKTTDSEVYLASSAIWWHHMQVLY